MASEKLIRNLADLQAAARQASQDGLCKIRLAGGETLVLLQPEPAAVTEPRHEVTDPGEEKAVLSCLRSDGRYYSGDEAGNELNRRLAARGIKN